MASLGLKRSGAVALFACMTVFAGRAALLADPALPLTADYPTVTLATACGASQPIATVHVHIRNTSSTPTAAQSLAVRDGSNAVSGSAQVPSLAPGATTWVDVPLNTADMTHVAGKRSVSVYLGSRAQQASLADTVLDVPEAFCGIRSSTSRAASSASTVMANPNRSLAHVLEVMPPLRVRAALNASDCAAHHSPVSCNEAVLDGGLLLLWEPPESGLSDGYRVYGVDRNGNGPTLLISVQAPGQTVVHMPAIHGTYAGRCYAVSTVSGSRESTKSNVFCATDDSSTKVTFLDATEARSVVKNHYTALVFKEITYGQVVGFRYMTEKHPLVPDDFGNAIHRSGFAFDVTPFVGHRLVRARLHLKIQTSHGMGNNYSCANSIGTGKEFWWKDDASPWIESDFISPVVPPTTGPQIVTDVTTMATPWFGGAPNYGFVIRNTDENLNAFTEKQCETTYESPMLEITYY